VLDIVLMSCAGLCSMANLHSIVLCLSQLTWISLALLHSLVSLAGRVRLTAQVPIHRPCGERRMLYLRRVGKPLSSIYENVVLGLSNVFF